MNILFVSRAKQNGLPSPVVGAQATSLRNYVNISVFLLEGKGWKAYWQGIGKLRRYLRENETDLIHAHYAWVGMVTSMATKKPLVVSLMGSDIEDFRIGRVLIRLFSRFCWEAVIVKSRRSKDRIGLKNTYVIPNGVDMELFRPVERSLAMKKVGFNPSKNYILFLADPARPEKNFRLVEEAFKLLGSKDSLALHTIHGVDHNEIPYYLSAADVLVITSLWEGSPNAVKEAMACNCPVVSTDVGDVKEVIGDTEGCYISSFDPDDVAEKLKLALDFGKKTNGRERTARLDEKIIARQLVEVYLSVLA